MSYKQQSFINTHGAGGHFLILVALIVVMITGCRKEPICERFTGDLLIRNLSENKQRVSIDALLVITVDGLSHLTVYDLTAGDYEVKAVDQGTGATACVFVKIERCKESEITI